MNWGCKSWTWNENLLSTLPLPAGHKCSPHFAITQANIVLWQETWGSAVIVFLMNGRNQNKAFNQHRIHAEHISRRVKPGLRKDQCVYRRWGKVLWRKETCLWAKIRLQLLLLTLIKPKQTFFFSSSYSWVIWPPAGTVITSFSAECFRNLKPPTLSPMWILWIFKQPWSICFQNWIHLMAW